MGGGPSMPSLAAIRSSGRKPMPADVARQAGLGFSAHHLHGVFPTLEDAARPWARADTMAVQEDHDSRTTF